MLSIPLVVVQGPSDPFLGMSTWGTFIPAHAAHVLVRNVSLQLGLHGILGELSVGVQLSDTLSGIRAPIAVTGTAVPVAVACTVKVGMPMIWMKKVLKVCCAVARR